jgi:hypothetical protein
VKNKQTQITKYKENVEAAIKDQQTQIDQFSELLEEMK